MHKVLSLFSGTGALCCDAIAYARLASIFKVTHFVEKDSYRITVLKPAQGVIAWRKVANLAKLHQK